MFSNIQFSKLLFIFKSFIANFPVDKILTVFLNFNLTLRLQNLSKAFISLSSKLTFISDIMKITVFSKLLLSMESGIPLLKMLFFFPYWAREFCSDPSLSIFSPVCYTFVTNSDFLPADVWLLCRLNCVSSLKLVLPLLISSLIPLIMITGFCFSPGDGPSGAVGMFFVSSGGLFSLSRYSDFCISFFSSFSPSQPLF